MQDGRWAASGSVRDFEQRDQLLGLVIDEPNFDDIKLEQVLDAMQDVRLEEFDPLFDREIENFVRLHISERAAGVLNGRQLVSLLCFDCHIGTVTTRFWSSPRDRRSARRADGSSDCRPSAAVN